MTHDIPTLLRAMMDALPGGQAALATRLNRGQKGKLTIAQPQISRWLKGQEPERPNYDRVVAVAQEMGVLTDVRSEDVASEMVNAPPPRTVKLKGYVGASSEAFYYRLADEDFEEVELPPDADPKTAALQIRGKSLGPLFDTFIIFYKDVRSPITDDLIGRMCVVGLPDDRVVVKLLQRGKKGKFTLISNSDKDPPLENVDVEWAALVDDIRPR